MFIRYSVSNLARKSTSSSFGSCVHGLGFFTKFFKDLIVSLQLLEYFDLLLSVYNSVSFDFAYFVIQKKSFRAFFHFSAHLMLARSSVPFAFLPSYWQISSCKFSIIGLISGVNVSFLYKLHSLFFNLEILTFCWEIENVLIFFLKQILEYSDQLLAEEWSFLCAFFLKKLIHFRGELWLP